LKYYNFYYGDLGGLLAYVKTKWNVNPSMSSDDFIDENGILMMLIDRALASYTTKRVKNAKEYIVIDYNPQEKNQKPKGAAKKISKGEYDKLDDDYKEVVYFSGKHYKLKSYKK